MSSEATVQPGTVVSIEYVLTDRSGKELDRSPEGKPLVYLAGSNNVVPGLDEGLVGCAVGESRKLEVPPAKGYGLEQKVKVQRILRSKFPADMVVERGSRFVTQDEKGRPFPIWVAKVQGREVHVTPQHPLAGVTLFFDVTVKDVRPATEEEVQHGHPHGPGGHDHGEKSDEPTEEPTPE